MSKRLLIISAVLIAIIAALPLVGNMSVKKVTDERIGMLEENGIKVERSDNGSNYLTTKEHFEFTLEDATAFHEYLSTLSKEQVPAYLSTMLDDVVMAADVEYSNLLVSSDVTLELYPVAFTEAASARMKAEDAKLYEQMTKMLDERVFMYHMEYDVAGEKFKGYIKDINREIVFEDGKKAKIVFESATFKGVGTLVKPKSVDLDVKHADLDFALTDGSKMILSMRELQSSNSFSSKNSFDLDYKAKTLHFFYKDEVAELTIDAAGLATVSDSKVHDGKLDTKVHASMEEFKLVDLNGSIALEGFDFMMDANNIDEVAYESFQKASEQAGSASQYTMLAAVGVVAKGMEIEIQKLSVKQLTVNDSKLMSGFEHKIDITIKADDNLVQKLQISPLALVQNIDIDARLKFSEQFYTFLKQQNPQFSMADGFAKHEADAVLFDVLMEGGVLSVNGQRL